MVPLRVSQCTEFALSDKRIFVLDMHLVRAALRQSVVCDQQTFD